MFQIPPPHYRFDLDSLAESPAQHVGHFGDQARQVQHLRLERLAAGEGEELASELGGALRGVDGVGEPTSGAFVIGHGGVEKL